MSSNDLVLPNDSDIIPQSVSFTIRQVQMIGIPLSEYQKVMHEKAEAEQKVKTLDLKIMEMTLSHQDTNIQYEQIISNNKTTIETLQREKAELEKKITDLESLVKTLMGQIDALTRQILDMDKKHNRLTRNFNKFLYAQQASKMRIIIHDFNEAYKAEDNELLSPPFDQDLEIHRGHRNSDFHIFLRKDSSQLEEYKKHKSLLCLEKLPSEIKQKYEDDNEYHEGFVDELIIKFRQQLGNQPTLDLNQIRQRERNQVDEWLSCLDFSDE